MFSTKSVFDQSFGLHENQKLSDLIAGTAFLVCFDINQTLSFTTSRQEKSNS